MRWLMLVLLVNAGAGTALSILVWLGERRLRSAMLVYGLWLLVVLKYLAPPLIGIRVFWPPAGRAVDAGMEKLRTSQAALPVTQRGTSVGESPGQRVAPVAGEVRGANAQVGAEPLAGLQPMAAENAIEALAQSNPGGHGKIWHVARLAWPALFVLWLAGAMTCLVVGALRLARPSAATQKGLSV